jgi:outer membrane receptor protein involved in Fe transport
MKPIYGSRLFACVCALVGTSSAVASAAEGGARAIEEVIVTAQRQAESLQEVPIAVTALTGQMLEDRQVITVSDLQMNAPNVSFTPTNFRSNSFSIRGIGRLLTAATGDAGVSIHVNEIAMGTNLNAVEFYDMERVEVLRGPQGTLYGKNATGGAVNFVTRMPDFDGVSGHIDGEYGDYSHKRLKGAVNLPITENLAVRIAGMTVERDGYTDNLAHGQAGLDGSVLPGIKDNLDGRDLYDVRVTALWEITDRASLWVQYNRFDEDDDRARITNQVCVTGPLPTYGCLPNEVGFEQPHQTSNFFNLVAGLYGLVPLGSPDLTGDFNWPRPSSVGLRKMHTDFQPVFKNEIDTWTFGFEYEFDTFSFGVVGGYSESEFLARQDYNMDVGPEVGPNFYRADGLYPISMARRACRGAASFCPI